MDKIDLRLIYQKYSGYSLDTIMMMAEHTESQDYVGWLEKMVLTFIPQNQLERYPWHDEKNNI